MSSLYLKMNSLTQSRDDLATLFGNYSEGVHIGVDARSTNSYGYSFDGGSNTKASYSQDLIDYTAPAEDTNEQNWSYDTVQVVHVNYDTQKSVSSFA